jgi:DNA invertase Pin-like site-specific DNA recombinase
MRPLFLIWLNLQTLNERRVFVNGGYMKKDAKYVTYLRVSTDGQGKSGLGLEAQRKAIADFVKNDALIVAEFVEVESGKKNDRPQLAKALAMAKQAKCVLLIAKLDRLARNVAFIANLLDSNVDVVAADMPEANRFMFHVMAAVAEQEAAAISDRTKAALNAAKARGVKLGWANPSRKVEQRFACFKGAMVNMLNADVHLLGVRQQVEALQASGVTTLLGLATALNASSAKTARGGRWHASTVKNLLHRMTDEPVLI